MRCRVAEGGGRGGGRREEGGGGRDGQSRGFYVFLLCRFCLVEYCTQYGREKRRRRPETFFGGERGKGARKLPPSKFALDKKCGGLLFCAAAVPFFIGPTAAPPPKKYCDIMNKNAAAASGHRRRPSRGGRRRQLAPPPTPSRPRLRRDGHRRGRRRKYNTRQGGRGNWRKKTLDWGGNEGVPKMVLAQLHIFL